MVICVDIDNSTGRLIDTERSITNPYTSQESKKSINPDCKVRLIRIFLRSNHMGQKIIKNIVELDV